MTIRELIEKLEKLERDIGCDIQVMYEENDGEISEVIDVYYNFNYNNIIIY